MVEFATKHDWSFPYLVDEDQNVAKAYVAACTPDFYLFDGELRLTLSPGRIEPTSTAWNSSRKPLAATYDFNGRRVVIVNNHFNSKGGDQPLQGVNQPPLLSSETQRRQQATLVNGFVSSIQTLDPAARVIVLGDGSIQREQHNAHKVSPSELVW